MSRFWAMVRNEWIKTSKQSAFQFSLLAYSGLIGLMSFTMHMSAVARPARPFALPGSWTSILGSMGPFPSFFVIAVVVFVVAHEFPARTARQNVIDGLSREQFFAAKALLVPAVAVLLVALLISVAGGIAMMGQDAERTEAIVRTADLQMFGRFLVGMTGFAVLAFFAATTVRSPGSALGLVFLYLLTVEQLILPSIATERAADGKLGLAYVMRWLPGVLFTKEMRPVSVSASPPRGLEALIAAAGGSAPPRETALLWGAIGWLAIGMLAAFLAFRRRDL